MVPAWIDAFLPPVIESLKKASADDTNEGKRSASAGTAAPPNVSRPPRFLPETLLKLILSSLNVVAEKLFVAPAVRV